MEGRREIEGAKLRLAAARRQLSAATETKKSAEHMMETAKQMMESADKTMDTATKEVHSAEQYLEETEKRLEVIEIDSESTPIKKLPQSKKRKVSPTQTQPEPKQTNGGATSWRCDVCMTATFLSFTEASIHERSCSIRIRGIEVAGCGISEANGTYEKSNTDFSDGVATYSKRGKWKGLNSSFSLYRRRQGQSKSWVLGMAQLGTSTQILYIAHTENPLPVPPNGHWITAGSGIAPAPKITKLLMR